MLRLLNFPGFKIELFVNNGCLFGWRLCYYAAVKSIRLILKSHINIRSNGFCGAVIAHGSKWKTRVRYKKKTLKDILVVMHKSQSLKTMMLFIKAHIISLLTLPYKLSLLRLSPSVDHYCSTCTRFKAEWGDRVLRWDRTMAVLEGEWSGGHTRTCFRWAHTGVSQTLECENSLISSLSHSKADFIGSISTACESWSWKTISMINALIRCQCILSEVIKYHCFYYCRLKLLGFR